MLMCKQAEKCVPLQAEHADWLEGTNEEIDKQDLEAHYSFMAKIQEVLPKDSRSNATPLEDVQYDDEYNERQHSEQPESIYYTYVLEKDDSNVIPDLSNMCNNDNQNSKDSSDPTTEMNMALALMAKAFKVNTIPTNNNQRSSLIPRNSQIVQPGMNTSQYIKMQMVDDNVGNQVRHNVVQNDGNKVGQNPVQNPGIQIVENMNGLSVVSEITNQYGNGNVVTAPAEGNGNGINGNPIRCYNCQGEGHYASNCTIKLRKRDVAYLQQQLQITQEEEARILSTQEEFEFMTAAYAHEEIERVKVNCTSEDTLQQASTSGTQSDNVPVLDKDGSAEVLKDENCYDHDIFNKLVDKI
ncbi:gag-pol polyprotein [Tanacetum coccineum]|uniref:Gag-pol polyprotein n=1 Tax=Tanacetum coccineum TaxID=301880 RepID=A0ABQ5ATD1_9ASTR